MKNTIKIKKMDFRKHCCSYPKMWTGRFYQAYSNASKSWKWNCKQCRPWSDYSCQRKNLFWVNTALPDLSVRIHWSLSTVSYYSFDSNASYVFQTTRYSSGSQHQWHKTACWKSWKNGPIQGSINEPRLWKTCLMRTTKAQISLHISGVWSARLFFAA